jgi:hypothetical protein
MVLYSPTVTGSLTLAGGTITVSGSSINNLTASFATTASFALNAGGGAGFPFIGAGNITGSLVISSSNASSSLVLRGSGSGVFTVDGTSGRLFSVDDSLSGSLFSVNTTAGLPVMEAFSDNTVRIGQYNRRALFVSQSVVGINKETALNGVLDISGSAAVTGSLIVSGSINTIGDISGSNARFTGTITAQTLVVQTVTSSVSFITGSTRFGSLATNTHLFTGSVSMTGSLAVVTNGTEFQVNASGVNLGNALTDSHVISGSLIVNPNGLFVSSSGNVGIGTITIGSTLQVNGGAAIGYSASTAAPTNGLQVAGNVNINGEYLTIGGATNNAVINNIASFRFNLDCDNNNTGESFTVGHNQTTINDSNVLFRILDNGNVGIGTTSPQRLLHLSSSGDTYIRVDGNNLQSLFGTDNIGTYIGQQGAFDLRLITNAAERFRITSAGTASFTGNSLATAADAATINLKQNSTTANTGIYLERSGEQKGYYIYVGGSADSLTFQRNNAGTKGDVMALTRDGNVGIGTTSPNAKLDINGNLLVTGSVTATYGLFNGYAINQNPTSAGTSATFTRYLNTSGDFYIGIENSAGSFFGATAYANTLYMGSANLEMFWSGVKKVTITSGGYLRLASSGIQFNGDTAAANALNDYEEGTFTPTLTIGGSSAGITYANRNAAYTRVGRLVTIQLAIRMTSIGSNTGDIKITGLPFSVISDSYYHPYGVTGLVLQPAVLPLYALGAGSEINFRKANVTTDTSPTHSDINNDTYIFVTMTYSAT